MSDPFLGASREARKNDFAEYCKQKKAHDDQAWQEDRMRVAMLDIADKAYNLQLGADLELAEKRRLAATLPTPTPISDGSTGPATGKDMFLDTAKFRAIQAAAHANLAANPEYMAAY